MTVLGIETSCDDCSVAVVEDGREILSNVVATQIEQHKVFEGVVPEIASRLHTEWIPSVVEEALSKASRSLSKIDGIAVTNRPGLVGSLLVGLSFAKGLSFATKIPYVGVNHILAHLYAPQLEFSVDYPFLGLLVSGGHTLICRVDSPLDIEVMGGSVDDACGEAFDKVAKHYAMGFPGGVAVDRLAKEGDCEAFRFPQPDMKKGESPYDLSYSGLKTAAINQLEQFRVQGKEASLANIAASFQKTAIDIVVNRLEKAVSDTGIKRVAAGGGVAANSYLRERLSRLEGVKVYYPSLSLCTDNGAMIAGIGYHYLSKGDVSPWSLGTASRVPGFKRFPS